MSKVISISNHKGGLDSLLGEQPRDQRGRPATSTREITKSSQEGTRRRDQGYLYSKRGAPGELKAIALERTMIKEVVALYRRHQLLYEKERKY